MLIRPTFVLTAPCGVESMRAAEAEPERRQARLRDLRRVDLRKPERPRTESGEQLYEPGSPSSTKERSATISPHSIYRGYASICSSEAMASPPMSFFLAARVSTERSQQVCV